MSLQDERYQAAGSLHVVAVRGPECLDERAFFSRLRVDLMLERAEQAEQTAASFIETHPGHTTILSVAAAYAESDRAQSGAISAAGSQ